MQDFLDVLSNDPSLGIQIGNVCQQNLFLNTLSDYAPPIRSREFDPVRVPALTHPSSLPSSQRAAAVDSPSTPDLFDDASPSPSGGQSGDERDDEEEGNSQNGSSSPPPSQPVLGSWGCRPATSASGQVLDVVTSNGNNNRPRHVSHRKRVVGTCPPGGNGEIRAGRAPRSGRFIGAGENDDADDYMGCPLEEVEIEMEEDENREILERAEGLLDGVDLDSGSCPICEEEQSRCAGADRLSAPHRAINALELDTLGDCHPNMTFRLMLEARRNLIEKPLDEELRTQQSDDEEGQDSRRRRNRSRRAGYFPWSMSVLKKHYGFGKYSGQPCKLSRRVNLAKRLYFLGGLIDNLQKKQIIRRSRNGWEVIDADGAKAWAFLAGVEDKLGKQFEDTRNRERLYRGLDTEDTAAGRAAAAAGWNRKNPLTNAARALAGPDLQSPYKFSGDI